MTSPQLTYHSLHLHVRVFSSMRRDGVNGGQYDEFNINPYYGDAPDVAMMNRKALCAELQVNGAHLLITHQVHGTKVRTIAEKFSPLLPSTRQRLLEGVNALITAIPHVCISVSTADYIPVLLYNEKHHTAAAIHAGWREAVTHIVQKTVAAMQQPYHTQPAHLHACVGPGISSRHFEVGSEMCQAFIQAGFSMPAISQHMDKWHVSLPECNRLQLLEVGVSDGRILSTGICTYEQVDTCFSARQLGIQSGRIYNGIALS